MPATAQQIIYKALRSLGVLASGEAPTAAEIQDALYSLNSMIDAFAANPQYYYYTQDEVLSLTTKSTYAIGNSSVSISTLTRSSTTATATTASPHGLQTGNSVTVSGATQTEYNITATITVTSPTVFTYTMAAAGATPATGTPVFTSGDFVTTRPIRIVGAFTRATNTDTPIGLVTEQYWTNIENKALTAAAPTTLLYRPSSPFGQVIVYPVPTGTLSIHLKTEKMVEQYSTITSSQYLPPGYQRLLELSLAVDLAPEYGARAAPETVAWLKADLTALMRTNQQKLPASKIGTVPNSNVYNDVQSPEARQQ